MKEPKRGPGQTGEPHGAPLQSGGEAMHSVDLLPCAVVKVPHPDGHEIVLMIPHRRGRLPVQLIRGIENVPVQGHKNTTASSKSEAILWQCADGRIEQVWLPIGHADLNALIGEINGHGLLVAEILDGPSQSRSQAVPVGHWVLKKHGSFGWLEKLNDE